MTTSATSTPRSASTKTRVEERPLALRRREDLILRRIASRGGATVVIKDPISLRYFQLGAEEGWILEQLDGTKSPAELCRDFNTHFAPRRIDLPQLDALLRRFRADNLLLAPGAEQADVLCEEGRRRLRKQRLFAWLQPWALRFRGIDPTRILNALYPFVRGLFTPTAAVLGVLLVVAALMLTVFRFDALTAKLPPLDAFLRWENALWLALALCVVKVLHELAHGLACRHYGAHCHELGVMLLAGVPCLYCNVTDSWLLPNRSQRVAIGAAGIVTEVLLASVALFLWWFSAPGFVNTLAFHIMLVCSVGTLVFNGNPLLRYDGYYVLSDALALPNLRDESIARVEENLLSFFTGIPPRAFASAGMPRWLAWYAVASCAYSLAVLIALAWMCYRWLAPWGAGGLVILLATTCTVGMIVPSATRIFRSARHEALSGEPVLRRFAWRGGFVLLLLAIFCFVPLPCRVRAPGVLVPRDVRQLYVLVQGELAEALPAGTRVAQGDIVARLVNYELAREVASLAGETQLRRARVNHLERLSVQDQDSSLRLPAARQALADTEERLRVARIEQDRLDIKAPREGVLLPPEVTTPAVGRHELPTWSGSPLDPSNRGATLLPETLLGSIGEPEKLVALLTCDEETVAQLAEGQAAVVVSDQTRDRSLTGQVVSISRLDMEDAPRELASRGLLPVRHDASGNSAAPATTVYQVRVELEGEVTGLSPLGGTVRAAVRVAPQSLATRAYRFLARTFASADR